MQNESFSVLQIGLTGSIGMGKSTVDKYLRILGISVFDADEEVHKLYGISGAAVLPIGALAPEAIEHGSVNRKILSERILKDPQLLSEIEKIVHPLVAQSRKDLTKAAALKGDFIIVHDIPLLFETKQSKDFDYVVVVSADAAVQRERVLRRPGMTLEKFDTILRKQVPDEEKRQKADFVIRTDFEGFSEARAQTARILESIILAQPGRWDQWKHRKGILHTYLTSLLRVGQ